MSKVEVYSKGYCPFCHRAKALLAEKGVDFIEYGIDVRPELRDEMISRANGGYTVPQIFINDKSIGGCDELYELEKEDKLDLLLN